MLGRWRKFRLRGPSLHPAIQRPNFCSSHELSSSRILFFFFLAYRRSQTDRRRELLRIFNLEIPQKIRPLSCPVERLPRGCASSLVSRCLTGNRPPGRSTKNAQLDSNLSSAVKYETQRTKSDERIKGILMTKLELGRLDKCKEF
jgi:hypothetical protein